MNNYIDISIIIPAYNVQEYIGTCLESVKSQTFNNYEVIVVNDGSTDGTQCVCEQYKEQIPTLKIINKTNEGQATARNIGTLKAQGKYVCYIDSDDWIAPTFLETLYSLAVKFNFPTIVQCGYYYSYDTYLLTITEYKNTDIKVLTKQEALKELINQKVIKNFPWGKIIKTEIAKANLMPNIPNYEDSYWFYNIIDSCDRYIVINTPLYYYRQREKSMTHTINESCIYLLDGYKSFYYFIKEKHPHLEQQILNAYLNLVFNIYTQTYNKTDILQKMLSEYLDVFIVQFSDIILNNNKISVLSKFKFFSLMKSKNLSYAIYLFERIINRLKPSSLIKLDK